MVTLTRRVNESIVIDSNIRVTVIHMRDQRVRLQIDAPDGMAIRSESSDDETGEQALPATAGEAQ